MNNSEWGNPNDFFMTFRCMKRKYARPFFKNGRIKFSTPASWVEYARQHGTGRGDHFEGSFATFNPLDLDSAIPLFKKYSRKYPDIVSMTIGSRCYLKRKRDMELPCLCMYYLKNKNFPCPDVEGIHELERTIPASYFRDFADNLPPEAIERLPEDDRPAIVMISDYPEFKRRLIEKLLELGVYKEEIFECNVNYLDFEQYGEDGWWDFGQSSPMELTIKHIRFEAQSEGRIIINTDRARIKELLKNPIEIGSIEDISQYCDQYFYDGIRVIIHADVVELPERHTAKQQGKISGMK